MRCEEAPAGLGEFRGRDGEEGEVRVCREGLQGRKLENPTVGWGGGALRGQKWNAPVWAEAGPGSGYRMSL